jgi:hypothetical protein
LIIGTHVVYGEKLLTEKENIYNVEYTTPGCDAERARFNEPSILDVTSRDDIPKGFEDGRMDRHRRAYQT